MATVFISGSTGYLGRPFSQSLVSAGFEVLALARPQSIWKVAGGCTPVPGDALDASTFADAVPVGSTYVHLTGVSHPNPQKASQFRFIDQAAFGASLRAAIAARARHFIYVSVAHPAPVMQAFIDVRKECEARLIESGLCSTILRPWYVLGPGHRWPYALIPLYKLAECIPAWSESAIRLGLVTHRQMMGALFQATSRVPAGVKYYDVAAIRAANFAIT